METLTWLLVHHPEAVPLLRSRPPCGPFSHYSCKPIPAPSSSSSSSSSGFLSARLTATAELAADLPYPFYERMWPRTPLQPYRDVELGCSSTSSSSPSPSRGDRPVKPTRGRTSSSSSSSSEGRKGCTDTSVSGVPVKRSSFKKNKKTSSSGSSSSSPSPQPKWCPCCSTRTSCQWRSGPAGRSLCNACGLRYQRGLQPMRILHEWRVKAKVSSPVAVPASPAAAAAAAVGEAPSVVHVKRSTIYDLLN